MIVIILCTILAILFVYTVSKALAKRHDQKALHSHRMLMQVLAEQHLMNRFRASKSIHYADLKVHHGR